MTGQALLQWHAAATLFMVGLIWFVQIVHYPLFAHVGRDGFAHYESVHSAWTTLVVGPPMLVELATAMALLFVVPARVPEPVLWLGVGLLGVIWLSTALLQVPMHGVLAQGFDADAHRRLVSTNWIRTVGWSLRGVLALWVLARA